MKALSLKIVSMWIFLKICVELLMPPTGLLLLACIGILLRRRYPLTSLVCGCTAVCLTLALSLPVLGWWLDRNQPHLTYIPAPWPEADAIVVLGGGRKDFAVEYGENLTASASTLERLRYAATVFRNVGKPILVSGGAPMWGAAQPEADIMQRILVNEFGVPVRWRERTSNDTWENAQNSALILRVAGVTRIYLVTHADHMHRAQANFEAQGLVVVPLATGFTPKADLSSWYFVPSFDGLSGNRNRLLGVVGKLRSG